MTRIRCRKQYTHATSPSVIRYIISRQIYSKEKVRSAKSASTAISLVSLTSVTCSKLVGLRQGGGGSLRKRATTVFLYGPKKIKILRHGTRPNSFHSNLFWKIQQSTSSPQSNKAAQKYNSEDSLGRAVTTSKLESPRASVSQNSIGVGA